MPQAETRRLAAIMFTDMVGFSRQMGADETRMLRLLELHNQIIQQAVTAHHGHVIKTLGDAFLVDFPSVVNAVQCAQQIQAYFQAHNVEKARDDQIHIRIGIHLGDIVQKDGDVLGDGVNIAARLQALAEPDTTCISQKVYEEVAKKIPLDTVVSLGRPQLKNIAERFQVYALLSQPPTGLRQTLRVQRLKLSRRVGRGVFVLVSVLLLGGLVLLLFPSLPTLITRAEPGLPLPDKPSIVVLPFTNLSGDPEQEYFSDGITEDLTTDLSKLSGLFVIARNSAFTYKGKAVKLQDVSQELGVRYVLEGSVRKADSQVRITAQLIDAPSGQHLWAERYDRELKDIFVLQGEIVRKIVAYLALRLTKGEQERILGQYVGTYTDNPEAYDSYMRGREYLLRNSKEVHAQARQLFERAIELDPTYAVAYAVLGFTYLQDWVFQWSRDPQALEQAFALAQKALALDDSMPFAHQLLGRVYQAKQQHEQAIAEAERAIVLAPNYANGYATLGQMLNVAGRPQDAIEVAEKALRLDPRNPSEALAALGNAYRLTGRYEEAIATFKKLQNFRDHPVAHMSLAIMYSETGREEEARAEAAEILRLMPNFSLEEMKQRSPWKDQTRLERDLAALRKAGLK